MNLPPLIHDITVRVEGKPGSGKSAFINWLHNELLKYDLEVTNEDEHIARIREKSDATNT